MSDIERGGQNVSRWPAEFAETDNPEGSVGEELRDENEASTRAQDERLAQLPEHERDVGYTDVDEESGLPLAEADEGS